MFARILDSDEREAVDVISKAGSGTLQITSAPKFASVADQIFIRGDGFQGDADRNRVEIGGKAALVLASSPVELILSVPQVPAASTATLRISEGAKSATTDITLVQVVQENSAPLSKGRKMKLVLRVEGTAEPLTLRVQNLTPQAVRLLHGDLIQVRTSGGQSNTAAIKLKAIDPGAFSFSVNLEGREQNADVQATRDFLAAAKKIAPREAVKLIKRTLKELSRENSGSTDSGREVLKIPWSAGSQDFQALMRAALRALNGN